MSPGPPGDGHRPAHARRRRHRALPWAVGLLVTSGLVAVGAVVVTGSAGDDEAAGEGETAGEDEADAAVTTEPAGGAETVTLPTEPAEVLALAAGRLEDEASFSFEGSTRVEGSAPEQTGVLVVQEGTSTGRADLPRVYTESTEQSDGSGFEIVIDGTLVWWRMSAFADRLHERPWVREANDPTGLSSMPTPVLRELPAWLGDATDHRDGGEDESGRTVVVANLSPGVLDALYGVSGDASFIRAELTVSVDDTGLPVRVQLEAATSDAVLELTYRLSDFGAEVVVEEPAADQVDSTPLVMEEDIADHPGPAPLGLTRVPAGWELIAALVVPNADPQCWAVRLGYANVLAPDDGFLWLTVVPGDCATDPPGGQPFTAGPYSGVVAESVPGASFGVLRVVDSAVVFETDLAVADLSVVLASLAPLDLGLEPAPIEGLPSSPD